MATKDCKHAGCRCAVLQDRAARGKEYCSDYCETHARQDAAATPHACNCGHAACAASAR
jgi:hypothetical protein